MRYSLKIAALGAAVVAAALPFAASAQSTATSTVNVTIAKFVNGQQATASSTGSASFGVNANWTTTNIGSGSGTFSLGPTGFNTSSPYQAVTAQMNTGSSYGLSEATSTTSGATCAGTSMPTFGLAGYSWGNSLAAAQAMTPTTTAPNLTNIQSNEFIIIWNRHCLAAPTPISPANGSATTTAGQQMVDWSDVSNAVGGITYVYQASNASTTNASGAFTTPIFTSGSLSSSTIATPNTPAGTYYWHVRAQDAAGNQSAWSPTWSFTVTGASTTPPTSTSTSMVHIRKYLDGALANASSAQSYLFPMSATWQAANLNGGAQTSGSFTLGNSFGGADTAYGANTAAMQNGASYSVSETTGTGTQTLPIGAQCTQGKYQLVGYTTSSTSFADAASKTPSANAPSFTNISGDQYVIVWNKKCADNNGGGTGTSTPPTAGTGSLWIQKFAIGGNGTFTLHGNGSIGSFQVTTQNGYGSVTLNNIQPGRYTIVEPGNIGPWKRFANTCKNIQVRAGQTAFCFITNRMPVGQFDQWESADASSWNDVGDLPQNTQ